MSNILVGQIYSKIIDEVVELNIATFEEEGVDKGALEEMRKTWQKNLTDRHVASMPWDPAPAQTPNPATLTSNMPRSGPPSQSLPIPPTSSQPSNNVPGVQIKAEPGTSYDLQNLPNNYNPNPNANPSALQRAGQQLQDRFGSGAAPQVAALQQRAAMANAQAQNQNRAPNTAQPTEEQRKQLENQQRLYLQQQQAARNQHAQAARAAQAIKTDQTDGAADWQALAAERRAAFSESADMSLRDLLEASAHEMEAGGLMLPHSEHKSPPSTRKRSFNPKSADSIRQEVLALQSGPRHTILQHDGPGDSDDDDKGNVKDDPESDEDAINSDLDDSEDEVVAEAEDGDNSGELMLCTYDKVQRVKNKWKCTLKDGVLTTGGREYVFHKAQGEFEW